MIRNRKRILKSRQEINEKINTVANELTIDEYLELKKRLIEAGRQ
jgi:hypothetical protein